MNDDRTPERRRSDIPEGQRDDPLDPLPKGDDQLPLEATTVRIDSETRVWIHEEALRRGVSDSEVIRMALMYFAGASSAWRQAGLGDNPPPAITARGIRPEPVDQARFEALKQAHDATEEEPGEPGE